MFDPKGPINYIPAFVQIMAWRLNELTHCRCIFAGSEKNLRPNKVLNWIPYQGNLDYEYVQMLVCDIAILVKVSLAIKATINFIWSQMHKQKQFWNQLC